VDIDDYITNYNVYDLNNMIRSNKVLNCNEVIHISNSPKNLRMGKLLNIKTLFGISNNCIVQEKELRKAGANYIFKNIMEINKII
jgi:hypothetical protein